MAAESELLRKGDEAFTREVYQEAADIYSKLIEENPNCADYLTKRSQSYMKLNRFLEAANDSENAIKLGKKVAENYLRKGMALYFNGNFNEAKTSFEEGMKLGESEKEFTTWLSMCADQIRIKNDTVTRNVKIKHDWYQTESQIILTVLVKDASPNDVTVDFGERKLLLKLKIGGASDQEDYKLDLNLSHEIDCNRSSYKVLKSKIEIKLQKKECVRWDKLEWDSSEPVKLKQIQPAVAQQEASKTGKNWDRIAQDLGNDDAEADEGEGAINDLFQKIYSEGSDEVKKAMNKSFMESGGTVLSTNWGEVGQQKVDVKPPDGMEFKKWED